MAEDELNHHVRSLGLLFGPDTSTSNRATLGGMLGNNSGGSHSIAYGLTVDHVLPVSRGGSPDRWENVVIACKRCNWRKANHRPEEVGLHLRRKPVPLTQEYAHIIFLRYPELKEAYDRLLATAA